MSLSCEPNEATRLDALPNEPVIDEAMRAIAVACNGGIYLGDRLDAIIMAVRLLRTRPDLAQAIGVAPTPDADLVARTRELMAWQKSGVLEGDALRNYAKALPAPSTDDLQLAEEFTKRAACQWVIDQAPLAPEVNVIPTAKRKAGKRPTRS